MMAQHTTSSPAAPAAAGRLIWLDVARGVALVAMAIYHFTWDLEFFGYTPPGTAGQGGWRLFARSIAASFLFLAGFSLVLGHGRRFRAGPFLKRLAMIVAAALAITVATYFATPDRFIFFGILHSIAAASVVGLLFLKLPWFVPLVAGIAALAAPSYLRAPFFDTPFLWWLGLAPTNPPSNDYVPLLPWLGPFLIGMAAAKLARSFDALHRLAADDPSRPVRLLALGGRHSLLVYLVHQPILIAGLYLASLVYPAPAADPVAGYQSSCNRSCAASNEAAYCARFCDCTLGALLDGAMFNDLMDGRITPANDERVAAIADQCSVEALDE